MKLLVLDQFSDLGGAQQGVLDLLPAIRERGWDARVGIPGTGEMFDRVRELGFAAEPIECGPYRPGRKSVGDMARFVAGTPRLAGRIAALAAGVDAVYINGPRLLPAAALARLRAPAVFHAHSFLAPGMSLRIAGAALRRMGASVIANCEFAAAPWRRYAERVTVVYNGVRGGAPSNGTDVACIGRIAPEKGQLAFLAAAALIHREIPDCRFAIYGAALFSDPGAEEYDRELRARAAGLPVEFRGWVADVYEALSRTRLLLVPSAAVEATTRVILEAYAAGVPVIAFRSGGIPEVVEDERTGLLAGSIEEMARLAAGLLQDPGRYGAMSAAARDCWQRRFTLERYQREVLAAIEAAAESAEPGR